MIGEEVRQTRFPRFGGNIRDLWSDRNIMLNLDLVEEALDTVIDSKQIPITEEPAIMLVSSETLEINKESTEVSAIKVTSVNSLRSNLSFNDTASFNNSATKLNPKENTTSLPLSLRNSPLSDNNFMNKEIWKWETKEVLIIILISSLSVIFIILTVAIIIIKVKNIVFPYVNISQP